jgi:hypothetical protein
MANSKPVEELTIRKKDQKLITEVVDQLEETADFCRSGDNTPTSELGSTPTEAMRTIEFIMGALTVKIVATFTRNGE